MEEDQVMTDSSDCLQLSNLPSNVISKIVRNLPVSYRKNFALTCKDFYKIVCHEDRYKYIMNIGGKEKKLYDVYDSIMASERVFEQIHLDTELSEQTLDLLTRIAAKHGSTVKTLTLDFSSHNNPPTLKASKFQAFLEEFENCNYVELHFSGPLELIGEPQPVLQNVNFLNTHLWSEDEYSIDIINITKFFQRNTFERLHVCVTVSQNFHKIFDRQRNVKKIYLSNGCENSNVFKNLKLESICFYGKKVDVFNQIIRDHAETLKKIRAGKIGSRTLDLICNQFTKLETLSLIVTRQNATSLLQISRLKKLNELALSFRNEDMLSSLNDIALIEMMSIKKLTVSCTSYNVPLQEEILDRIGTNWPNIEELSINHAYLPLGKVLMRFKKLKIVKFFGGKFSYEYNGHTHLEIENLIIEKDGGKPIYFPPYTMLAVPNLKALEIENCQYLGVSMLKVLNDMKTLKDLKIKFNIDSEDLILNYEDIEELKKLMHRLEVCEIKFSAQKEFHFIDELAERLKDEVFEIKEEDGRRELCIKIKY